MRKTIFILVLLLPSLSFCQQWVDTVYAIQSLMDTSYGTAIDFAGKERRLGLDISWPVNDTAPACGRPLVMIVHGGAWLGGKKDDAIPSRMREDFAKRGYVAASVQYRLGLFHTNRSINCNIPDWNCFNMTDTSEWYRANYRAIQDVHGAIRFLVNDAAAYEIDPENVFLIGESAGGFVAMGVGFLDDSSEVMHALVDSMPDAPAPNQLYENACIKAFDLAEDIDSMDLSRPALGDFKGKLNLPLVQPYRIRAVGNIYGGAFSNIFASKDSMVPALYLFHRPCDLIVPFNYSRLLAGYVNCTQGFPAFCGNIVNRARSYGSRGIRELIDTLHAQGRHAPRYEYDIKNDRFNCLQQASSPSMNCHAIDDFWLRTGNIARLFSQEMQVCMSTSLQEEIPAQAPFAYPNPCREWFNINWNQPGVEAEITLSNALGQKVLSASFHSEGRHRVFVGTLPAGTYYLKVCTKGQQWNSLLLKSD